MRARLVLALLATSAITLAVAALALLNPLEKRLRHEEVKSLLGTATASRAAFEDLPADVVKPGSRVMLRLARGLERRSGARVAVFTASGTSLVDTHAGIGFGSLPTNATSDRPVGRVVAVTSGATEARVAVPLEIAHDRYLLALRKPLDDVTAAAADVRRAFTTAALAGLGIALLLGIGFAAYVTRRLRRLRDAAVNVAEVGPEAPLPVATGRDEVGDLGRSFRRMQQRLRELEEARTQFLATASHELRTPVASLQAMLELASQDLAVVPADLADAREQVERAEAQSRRLGELAADLLDLTRLDTGIDLREEPVELGEICRAVVAEFGLRTAGREGRLEFDHSADAVWAQADPTAVARIARILIDNALRYTPRGTQVRIDVETAGTGVELSVTDSGPGVLEEERELIFERFRRGSKADGGTGFGLGLAIGRGLAARMHGELRLEASQRGARFVLRLPSAVGAAVPG